MGNGTGALYGFLYQLCWSVVRALESTVCIQRPLDPQRTPNGLVRLELEGASDITERQGSLLRYIQVKSRGRGSARWTLPALLSEVLTSFAQIEDDVTSARQFVFVTDADLDENCQHLAALGEELRRRAHYMDSDEAWKAAAETLPATGRVVTPRSSPKTLGDRLSCPVEELPGELATRGVFPGLHTPGAVARFIAAVRLVGPASLEALRERVRDDLRKRVPKDKVDDFERELIAKCLEYCSLRAGHQFTGAELLEQVGIMGEEYRWDLLVARSAQALPERIRLMPPREPQYAVREEAHRTFRDFLASESRVIVILGPARTGKTRLAWAL